MLQRHLTLCYLFSVFCSLFSVFCSPSFAQQEFEITIQTTLGDTTETFWLQIPQDYQPGVPCPLLIGWHQWGGNHLEFKYQTDFDSIANVRGWIAASHFGTSATHWNNHPTQSHVVDVINWISQRLSVDSSRIYMVGSSMGGAAGMVFSNNHLDPEGPIVAAAASVSGIQDCERRYYEQGINNTMIASFGGTPEQVPYEYHRNSAIYFADSTRSMHFNALHLSLYLTFGCEWSDSVWRRHAEDLYEVMVQFADTVVLHESAVYGHGWSCCEEELICDFFQNFSLNRYPVHIAVNADEEGDWYWADITMRNPIEAFARFEGWVDTALSHIDFSMLRNVQSASLDLSTVGFSYDVNQFTCSWSILDGQSSQLTFEGVPQSPYSILKNSQPYIAWAYDPLEQTLTLDGEGSGLYTIIFESTSPPPVSPAPYQGPIINARLGPDASLTYEISASGTLSWELYDITGRKISRADLGWQDRGLGRILFNGELAAGVYFLYLQIDGTYKSQTTEKIIIVK